MVSYSGVIPKEVSVKVLEFQVSVYLKDEVSDEKVRGTEDYVMSELYRVLEEFELDVIAL